MIITIGASKNNQIGSKLIQWWTKAHYSHVYISWRLRSQSRDIVYHASKGLVHFLSLDNFKKKNKIIQTFVLHLTDEQFANFSSKCIDLAGEKYSKLELLQIFLSDISQCKLKLKDQPGFICSELIATLLVDIGIISSKPPFLMTPGDIVALLASQPGNPNISY